MPATVSVVYPKGVEFDMSYYISTHMPLVAKKFGPHGLKSWKVVSYPDDCPYKVQALLEMDSLEDWKKMFTSAEAAEVFGDVKNFSDKDAIPLPGSVEGTS